MAEGLTYRGRPAGNRVPYESSGRWYPSLSLMGGWSPTKGPRRRVGVPTALCPVICTDGAHVRAKGRSREDPCKVDGGPITSEEGTRISLGSLLKKVL